ncbi:hypothetical protein JOF46_000761 [Paeniglutamicibacter psychrophenolicus]|uniref:Holin n=1 Tax=Paeniglutamicibacter psychrophenolicus TaxID=257454 RepID=A0ABS4WB73_9MICC|nr:hypothetical protein [Paeniglutamicibacter psychrophenolicus]
MNRLESILVWMKPGADVGLVDEPLLVPAVATIAVGAAVVS